MKTRVWLVAAAVLVVLLGVLGYVLIGYFLTSSRYGLQELSQAEVREDLQGDSYALDFLSRDDVRVAGIYVRVNSWENISTMLVEIWHEEGSEIDKISLTFDPMFYDALFLKAPRESWPLAQFGTDGTKVIYSIPDAGFLGTGTMLLEFCIRKDILSLNPPAGQVCLHVDFTMHRDDILSKTKQHGEGDIFFEIP